jgi:hypothetical protein
MSGAVRRERVRFCWALTELVADCAVGAAMVWLVLAPLVFVLSVFASVVADGRQVLAAVLAVVVLQAVGALTIGVPVAAAVNLRGVVRWLEVRPAPARVVLRLWCRRHTVAVTHLTEVVVRECRRYGGRARVEVDLVTPSRTLRCWQGRWSPLRGVDSQALAGWLSEVLATEDVVVRHEFAEVVGRVTRRWWSARRVAAVWGVPASRVPDLARRWEVATTTRSGRPVYWSVSVEAHAAQVKGA